MTHNTFLRSLLGGIRLEAKGTQSSLFFFIFYFFFSFFIFWFFFQWFFFSSIIWDFYGASIISTSESFDFIGLYHRGWKPGLSWYDDLVLTTCSPEYAEFPPAPRPWRDWGVLAFFNTY